MNTHLLEIDVPTIRCAVEPAYVERIVDNLLRNTARHTPPGADVWVKVTGDESEIQILVEDVGPGVPPELAEAIFSSFTQGPALRPYSPGVGVGLSIVARLAEMHGGTASVEERPGGGARFRVILPGEATYGGTGVRCCD